METTSRYARFNLLVRIGWQKDGITHEEHFLASQFNPWRDSFPGSMLAEILETGKADGSRIHVPAGRLVPERDPQNIIPLPWSRIRINDGPAKIHPGRFYPQGMITGLTGVFKGNTTPFRVVESDDDGILADLNHPLAGLDLEVSVVRQDASARSHERGGSCTDWMDLALSGPGMQARPAGPPGFSLPGP